MHMVNADDNFTLIDVIYVFQAVLSNFLLFDANSHDTVWVHRVFPLFMRGRCAGLNGGG